jgi:hypothetical protein
MKGYKRGRNQTKKDGGRLKMMERDHGGWKEIRGEKINHKGWKEIRVGGKRSEGMESDQRG